MVVRALVLIASFVLGIAGFIAVFVGLADQNAADSAYVADFGSPGDDCGSAEVHFDEDGGGVLTCAGSSESSVDFPGFTDAQNEEIESLALTLGEGGLSDTEQERIQQRIDDIAARVPDSDRPRYEPFMSLGPVWGAGLAWAGGGALLLGVLGIGALVRGV
jgi:hypothetical protein